MISDVVRVWLAVLAFVSVLFSTDGRADDLEYVREAVASAPRMKDLSFTLESHQMPGYAPFEEVTITSKQVFQGARARKVMNSSLNGGVSIDMTAVYDGAQGKVLSHYSNGQQSAGTVMPKLPRPFFAAGIYDSIGTSNDGRVSVEDGLASPSAEWQETGKTPDGVEYYRVRYVNKDTDFRKAETTVTMDLAPAYGWLPIRFEETWGTDQKSFKTYIAKEFQQVDGHWFPALASHTQETTSPQGERKVVLVTELKYSDVKIDQGVPEGAFEIEFPPKTQVSNEILGTVFVVEETESLPKVVDDFDSVSFASFAVENVRVAYLPVPEDVVDLERRV